MRREIFERVARRPASVGELAESLPITRQAVSPPMGGVGGGGLVAATGGGAPRVVRVKPPGRGGVPHYPAEPYAAERLQHLQPQQAIVLIDPLEGASIRG